MYMSDLFLGDFIQCILIINFLILNSFPVLLTFFLSQNEQKKEKDRRN